MKTAKQLERYFKGVSNHRRIDILLLVNKGDGISVEKIAEELECNLKTISEHIKKLVNAGLLNKKYKGRYVLNSLSPYGKEFVNFLRKF